jgi:hypothetical protein
MLTNVCQRWRDHRASYRPAGEPIDPRDFDVELVERDVARAFVEQHHYSHAWPAARKCVGLFHHGELAGVAVASTPMHAKVLEALPGTGDERAELGRRVLLDEVKSNGESWFLARAFELFRAEGLVSLVSFSDPTPRTADTGEVVFKGHIGNVYQASNAVYTGRATPHTMYVLPWGDVLAARSIQKIRSGERGWKPAAELMVRAGARPMAEGEDPRAWVRSELGRCTRNVRNKGNHRYLFGLDKAARKVLAKCPDRLPYPKFAADAVRLAPELLAA